MDRKLLFRGFFSEWVITPPLTTARRIDQLKKYKSGLLMKAHFISSKCIWKLKVGLNSVILIK